MKEIFEQYGGAIITVIAIISLAALITLIVGNDDKSPIFLAFRDLIKDLEGTRIKP